MALRTLSGVLRSHFKIVCLLHLESNAFLSAGGHVCNDPADLASALATPVVTGLPPLVHIHQHVLQFRV